LAWSEVRCVLDELDRRCADLMHAEGIAPGRAQVTYSADVCYIGQSYHLEVPISPAASAPLVRLFQEFRSAHDRVYGHRTAAPAPIVNLRAIHRCAMAQPGSAAYAAESRSRKKTVRRILTIDSGGFVDADIHERNALAPGTRFAGPAIVEQGDTTTLV